MWKVLIENALKVFKYSTIVKSRFCWKFKNVFNYLEIVSMYLIVLEKIAIEVSYVTGKLWIVFLQLWCTGKLKLIRTCRQTVFLFVDIFYGGIDFQLILHSFQNSKSLNTLFAQSD